MARKGYLRYDGQIFDKVVFGITDDDLKNVIKGNDKNDRTKKYSVPSIQEARKGRKETNYVSYEFDPKLENFGVGKKYIIKTYGCQGNLADSEKMSGILQRMGYTEVQEESEADVILVNTCAIRENAEQRVFGEIGRLKKYKQTNPHLIIGICGCMPQEEKVTSKIRDDFSHVDIAFGTHNLPNLGEYIYQATLI